MYKNVKVYSPEDISPFPNWKKMLCVSTARQTTYGMVWTCHNTKPQHNIQRSIVLQINFKTLRENKYTSNSYGLVLIKASPRTRGKCVPSGLGQTSENFLLALDRAENRFIKLGYLPTVLDLLNPMWTEANRVRRKVSMRIFTEL